MPEELIQNEGQNNLEKPIFENPNLKEEDLINLVNSYFQEFETPNYDEKLTELITNEFKTTQQEESQPPQTERKYAGIFNTVEDLEKSYKELQSEYTRVNQRYKKFEKYESLIDLIEKDPRIRDKIVEIIYSTYYGSESTPGRGTSLKEEDFDLFEEETKFEKTPKLDISGIQRMIENVINEKLKEFFGVVNAIQDFATKHNLDRDTLKEIIEISKREGITLDEALAKYNEKVSKIKEKLLKEIGAVPQVAPKEQPKFTSTNLTGATRGTREELDFSQGWSKLPREKQLELLLKYSPFI